MLTAKLHEVRLLGQHVTPEGVVERQAVVTFSVVPFDTRTHRALTTTVGLRVDELRRSTLPGIGKVTGAAIVRDTPLTDRHGMLYRVSFTTEATVKP